MDLNVICSRRVHDGYATIRSRGRPRALYRSDSEELLKEAGGPYALPCLSNFRIVADDIRQVPRWADLGENQRLIENYSTLRVVKSSDLEEQRQVTLKTFSKRERSTNNNNAVHQDRNDALQRLRENNGKNCASVVADQRKRDQPVDVKYRRSSSGGISCGWKTEYRHCGRKAFYSDDTRIYDKVPIENDPPSLKPFRIIDHRSSRKNNFVIDNNHCARDSKSNFNVKYDGNSARVVENNKRTSLRDLENVKNDIMKTSTKCASITQNEQKSYDDLENNKERNITVLANVKNDSARITLKDNTRGLKNEERPLGDLENDKRRDSRDRQPIYAIPNVFSKSTRRECEADVVDGNYVPSGDLYRTTAKYIEDINRNLAEIDKSYEELKASPRNCGVINRIARNELFPHTQACKLSSYARKRDMVPMPPINTDIDEVIEDRNDKESRKDIRYLRRPNSRGKLPPRVLPRSSSIDNTSRHSTGSTTASSSKSTESLYAISESLTELPQVKTSQDQDQFWGKQHPQGMESKRRNSQNLLRSSSSIGSNTLRRLNGNKYRSFGDTEGSESKDETSSTDDDVSITKGGVSSDRLPVTSAIRRNRSRVDQAGKSLLKKERSINDISEKVAGKCEVVRLADGQWKDRRYDTMPARRPRISSKPLHKSSEDVLDGEKITSANSRSWSGNSNTTQEPGNDENFTETVQSAIYTMDATELILKGQMERSNRTNPFHHRTRHNSLESEKESGKIQYGSFATLPRRGNLTKDQCDPVKRFSGNGSCLEPLYEHAVSDPVKPRRSSSNVIPWWELATKKYRHLSCPSLPPKVNLKMNDESYRF